MREMGWEVNFKTLAPGSQHAPIISLASSTVPLSARTLTYEVWLLNNETTYELTATLNQEVTGEGGSIWHNGRPTASLCSVEDYNALVCNGWNTLNQRGAEIWCFSFLLNSNNSSPLKELSILTGPSSWTLLAKMHPHFFSQVVSQVVLSQQGGSATWCHKCLFKKLVRLHCLWRSEMVGLFRDELYKMVH